MTQIIGVNQKLTETWEIVYERPHYGKPIRAMLSWPHGTIYALYGYGQSVEEARLDVLLKTAAAVADDPNAEPPAKPETVKELQKAARRGLRAVG